MYHNPGIEVICGPMGSGKSEELIRKLTRYTIAGRNVIVFKHVRDTRDGDMIKSRNGAVYENNIKVVESAAEIFATLIFKGISENTVIAIDEAQFFDDGIIKIIQALIPSYTIIISGLEKDFMGNPFGPMPQLLAIADNVEKLTAVCMKCKNNPASFTYKKNKSNNEQVEVGGDELYEARCATCWKMGQEQ